MNKESKEAQELDRGDQVPITYPFYYIDRQADAIDIIEIWNILLRRKNIIFFTILGSILVSLFIALTSQPVYRAEALLSPANKGGKSSLSSQFSGLASIVGININSNENGDIQTVLAILKSRKFTKQFIKENNLRPILLKVDKTFGDAKQDVSNESLLVWQEYEVFNEIRGVAVDKRTGLITLSIEWNDPVLAAQWVNKLVERINVRLRVDALNESEQNLDFLREQIDKTSVVDIQQAMFGLIEAEMKKAMLANVNREYAFKVIDDAVAPEFRVRPNRRKIMILGTVLGLVLGVGLAFLINYFDAHKNRLTTDSR